MRFQPASQMIDPRYSASQLVDEQAQAAIIGQQAPGSGWYALRRLGDSGTAGLTAAAEVKAAWGLPAWPRGHCLLQRRMGARDSNYQAAIGNCGNESARCLGLPWSQNECGVTGERCFSIYIYHFARSPVHFPPRSICLGL